MEQKYIVAVEDDADIRELLRLTLASAGYRVAVAADGREGLDQCFAQPPDLILLDLTLPGLDGLDVCRALKREPRTAAIPIIMLTARGEEVDRIVGLEVGAEDYLVKPFSPRELVLRIKGLLRRVSPAQPGAEPSVLAVGDLLVDREAHSLKIDGRPVSLTATEFRLLHELLSHQGKVRSREQLLSRVWGYSFDGYARTVDTHIRRLRQKLGEYADRVETLRGVGYRFRERA